MRIWVNYLIAILVLAGSASLAEAKKKTVRAAILPTEVQDVPSKLGVRLKGVIAKELKAIGVFRVVPGKVAWNKIKRLMKKRVYVKGCAEKSRCVKAVGRNLRAKVLYRLKVSKAEEGLSLSMGAYDVKSGKEIRSATETAAYQPNDIDRATRWVTRKVSSPMLTTLAKGKGKLQIDCDQEGADLYLNGKSFGKRTGKSFKVGTGVFDVQVKKEGFETFHDVVVVKVGQRKMVKAMLKKSAETKPVEVAVAPIPPPVEKKPETTPAPEPEPKKKEVKTSDLPAWAVFEKPKPKALQSDKKKEGDQGKAAAVMPWQKPKKTEPYLPGPKKEEPKQVDRGGDDDAAFYQTWWFWTIIGVGAAAAGGTAAYFVLFEDGGGTGEGSALIQWD